MSVRGEEEIEPVMQHTEEQCRLCGFTCRESEDECSSKMLCYDLNKQTHSYPTLYAVLKPCEDGLKQDGAWIEEVYEPIIGQYSNCSKTVANRMSKELLVVNEVI